MPKISVIVVLNSIEDVLIRSFDSLLKQEYKDFECICVHPDPTLEVSSYVKNLCASDSRFKLIVPSGSVTLKWDCYNIALASVKGEYLMFMNDTDILHPMMLSILFDSLRYTHADVVTSPVTYFTGNSKLKQVFPFDKGVLKHKSKNLLFDFLEGNSYALNASLEGKMFKFSSVATVKFQSSLKMFSPYFYIEQILSKIENVVYMKFPVYYLKKEAHIPSLSTYETLYYLCARSFAEESFFIENKRVGKYISNVLRYKCSQDFFKALQQVIVHMPESTLICVYQQILGLIEQMRQKGFLKGLDISLFQRFILLLLGKNKLSFVKVLLKLF